MIFKTISITAIATVALTGCLDMSSSDNSTEQELNVPDNLKDLRTSTARYNDINNALADGYQLGFMGAAAGCVARPAAAGGGAMGYHYFRWDRMSDPTIDANAPEVLVYHTGTEGQMVLGAVEWVVKKENWETIPENVGVAPSVLGNTMTIINPALNWYVLHAWIWTENPAGLWENWNPDVTCP